ncbi:hypothetical protein E2562_032315 [Oryza meyeriana var. granulata]|uniref:Uncharacterized protein n=1 Tax=Oryza meyeriana var. granulata TaxID=110450 RepID=A0A6G1ERV5_9ORYZ|nr:hypothetical protein E2562_032315 [Oryza meyeriana var. granulata]
MRDTVIREARCRQKERGQNTGTRATHKPKTKTHTIIHIATCALWQKLTGDARKIKRMAVVLPAMVICCTCMECSLVAALVAMAGDVFSSVAAASEALVRIILAGDSLAFIINHQCHLYIRQCRPRGFRH